MATTPELREPRRNQPCRELGLRLSSSNTNGSLILPSFGSFLWQLSKLVQRSRCPTQGKGAAHKIHEHPCRRSAPAASDPVGLARSLCSLSTRLYAGILAQAPINNRWAKSMRSLCQPDMDGDSLDAFRPHPSENCQGLYMPLVTDILKAARSPSICLDI